MELYQVVWVDGNTAIRNIVEEYTEKIGGQYEGLFRNWTVDAEGNTADCHRYTLTREQYFSSKN